MGKLHGSTCFINQLDLALTKPTLNNQHNLLQLNALNKVMLEASKGSLILLFLAAKLPNFPTHFVQGSISPNFFLPSKNLPWHKKIAV